MLTAFHRPGHPLGGVVGAFAKLFNRNYRPAEDCYRFFDDALDDIHSFLGKPSSHNHHHQHSLLGLSRLIDCIPNSQQKQRCNT